MYQGGNTHLYWGMYAFAMPANALNKAVAAELTAARQKAELSNRQVSDRTGIPEVSVQRYMAGTRAIKIDDLGLIAVALGEDPIALFGRAVAATRRKD